jgi:hypothetical protein
VSTQEITWKQESNTRLYGLGPSVAIISSLASAELNCKELCRHLDMVLPLLIDVACAGEIEACMGTSEK